MYRIILMVIRLWYKVPYYMLGIWWSGKNKRISDERAYAFVQNVTKAANKAGRVTIKSYGIENIPKESGFVFFPNHQGLFDVLAFLESCPVPFAFVIKKEASRIILLRQVIAALGSYAIDRDDIKQSMKVIQQVTEDVKRERIFSFLQREPEVKRAMNCWNLKAEALKVLSRQSVLLFPAH